MWKKGLLHGALTLLAVAAFLWWMGVGRSKETPEPPEDQRPPTRVPAETAAVIRGRVEFQGVPPEPPLLLVTREPGCKDHLAGKRSEEILVRDGKVANAFIWISGGLEPFVPEAAKNPVVIDQSDCLFVPHVRGCQVRQRVIFRNSDTFPHNIKGDCPHPPHGFLFSSKEETTRFWEPDRFTLTCTLHSWMKAYVQVVPHGYFAVTGEDGSFELPKINPGPYTVSAWHEVFGAQEEKVEVKAKETKDVKFIFRAK